MEDGSGKTWVSTMKERVFSRRGCGWEREREGAIVGEKEEKKKKKSQKFDRERGKGFGSKIRRSEGFGLK